jgi:hypothetical protein
MRFPLAGLRGLQTFLLNWPTALKSMGFSFIGNLTESAENKKGARGRLSILFWQLILQLTLLAIDLI